MRKGAKLQAISIINKATSNLDLLFIYMTNTKLINPLDSENSTLKWLRRFLARRM